MVSKKLEKQILSIKSDNDYLIPNNKIVYQKVVSELISPIKNLKADKVMAIDLKGLMYGPIVADRLGLAFAPIIKGNKIKARNIIIKGESFIDYSNSEKSLEIFKKSVHKGERIILIDDWFDSGKTARSAIGLIEKLGGKIVGISIIFNQLKPEDQKFFKKYNLHSIIRLNPKM